jgi:hypothetical protein
MIKLNYRRCVTAQAFAPDGSPLFHPIAINVWSFDKAYCITTGVAIELLANWNRQPPWVYVPESIELVSILEIPPNTRVWSTQFDTYIENKT